MSFLIDCKKQQEIDGKAIAKITVCDDVKVNGPIPDVKETFICARHGEQPKVYYPIYERLTDGIKGIPCRAHTVKTILQAMSLRKKRKGCLMNILPSKTAIREQEKELAIIEKIKVTGYQKETRLIS